MPTIEELLGATTADELDRMTFKWEVVTPAMAAAWLANPHPRQRTVTVGRASKTHQYAASMSKGDWDPAVPQGIFLAEPDERLLNGYHRLNAIVISGASVVLNIVRHVPERVFDVIDTGKPRTPGQFLGNTVIGNTYATVGRWLLWYEQRFEDKPTNVVLGSFAPRDVIRYVESHCDDIEVATAEAIAANKAAHMPKAIHAAALVLARWDGADEGRLAMYLEGIQSGAFLAPDDPRMLLRTRYLLRVGKRHAGTAAEDWHAIVTALNAYLAAESPPKTLGRTESSWPRVGESQKEYEIRRNREYRLRGHQTRQAARRRKWSATPFGRSLTADASVVREIVDTTGATLPEAMAASGRTD